MLITLLRPFFVLALAFTLLASGCALYKPQIQQGNLITSEQVAQLQPGMNRAQVQGILGSPLLASMFHTDRWDYLYRAQKGGQIIEARKFTLNFEGDKLVKFGGDPQPSEKEAARLGSE